MICARHDGLAAKRLDGLRNFRGVGGDHDAADACFLCPAQDVDDHRQTRDIEQRLSGQARCGHAGGNQHKGAGV